MLNLMIFLLIFVLQCHGFRLKVWSKNHRIVIMFVHKVSFKMKQLLKPTFLLPAKKEVLMVHVVEVNIIIAVLLQSFIGINIIVKDYIPIMQYFCSIENVIIFGISTLTKVQKF